LNLNQLLYNTYACQPNMMATHPSIVNISPSMYQQGVQQLRAPTNYPNLSNFYPQQNNTTQQSTSMASLATLPASDISGNSNINDNSAASTLFRQQQLQAQLYQNSIRPVNNQIQQAIATALLPHPTSVQFDPHTLSSHTATAQSAAPSTTSTSNAVNQSYSLPINASSSSINNSKYAMNGFKHMNGASVPQAASVINFPANVNYAEMTYDAINTVNCR